MHKYILIGLPQIKKLRGHWGKTTTTTNYNYNNTIYRGLSTNQSVFTSIQYHVWLDVTGCQSSKELAEQAGESVIIPSMLLVQTVVEVEAEIQTAAVNNQTAVPKLHILEESSVPLHIGGQTLDTHGISGPAETRSAH